MLLNEMFVNEQPHFSPYLEQRDCSEINERPTSIHYPYIGSRNPTQSILFPTKTDDRL